MFAVFKLIYGSENVTIAAGIQNTNKSGYCIRSQALYVAHYQILTKHWENAAFSFKSLKMRLSIRQSENVKECQRYTLTCVRICHSVGLPLPPRETG